VALKDFVIFILNPVEDHRPISSSPLFLVLTARQGSSAYDSSPSEGNLLDEDGEDNTRDLQ
jgi:hypothetical protein